MNITKGKDGSLKLCCPDCVNQGINKTFKNWSSLKYHLLFGAAAPGHQERTLPEIYRLIFRSEVIRADGRDRKKKQIDQGQKVKKPPLELTK